MIKQPFILVNLTGRKFKSKNGIKFKVEGKIIYMPYYEIHFSKTTNFENNLILLIQLNEDEPTYYYKSDFEEIELEGTETRKNLFNIPLCLN